MPGRPDSTPPRAVSPRGTEPGSDRERRPGLGPARLFRPHPPRRNETTTNRSSSARGAFEVGSRMLRERDRRSARDPLPCLDPGTDRRPREPQAQPADQPTANASGRRGVHAPMRPVLAGGFKPGLERVGEGRQSFLLVSRAPSKQPSHPPRRGHMGMARVPRPSGRRPEPYGCQTPQAG